MQNYKQIYNIIMLIVIVLLIGATYFVYSKKYTIINDFTSSIMPSNQDKQNLLSKVDQLYNSNDFKTANSLLDQQLSANPNNTVLLLAKASVLAQEASLTFREKELGDQAKVLIKKVLETDPKNIESLTLLGYVYEIQQDYVNAHKYYDIALGIDPKSVSTLTHKGHAFYLQGKLDEAQKNYEQAVKLDSSNTTVKFSLAQTLYQEGKLLEAKQLLIQVADATTNLRQKAEALYSVGVIGLQTNDSKAIDYIKQSNQLDPSYPAPYVKIAEAEFAQVINPNKQNLDTEKAKLVDSSFANLQKAIELNPNLSFAYYQVAKQLYILGQKNEAVALLKKIPNYIENDITLTATEKNAFTLTVNDMYKTINK